MGPTANLSYLKRTHVSHEKTSCFRGPKEMRNDGGNVIMGSRSRTKVFDR